MNVEFVDTNILLYAHEPDAGPKLVTAVSLIDRLGRERCGALSTQVLMEFYAAATKKLRMPSEEAESVISDLGGWIIHKAGHGDVIRAAQLHRRYGLAWWDCLVVTSAMELGCTTLWTEDLQNGQQFGSVTVRNPFAESAIA